MGLFYNIGYNIKGAINIFRGDIIHNTFGAAYVLWYWHIQKLKAGLVNLEHAWCTGVNPETKKQVWIENAVFRTKVAEGIEENDEKILEKVGNFLASMVKKSAITPEIEQGKNRRMPHVVNYLHGSVHYNGMWLLFNNFEEAKYFFSDPKFRKEFKRLVKTEKREVTLVFRERKYDPLEYAYFSGFIMSNFPWFANVNGPGKKVMWGNPSPYPAMNIINGNWVNDVRKMKNGDATFMKKPVITENYFEKEYGKIPKPYFFVEKFIAFIENEWVRRRGFNAGLFFINRKEIDPKLYETFQKDREKFDALQFKVPNPLNKEVV